MLNLNDTHLAALIAKPLSVSQLRQQISTAYQTETDRLADSPLWGANDDALTALLASYTGLMRDKLYQTLQNMASIPANFLQTLWFKDTTTDSQHSEITLIQATENDNNTLLTIVNPLSADATLKAVNLPTLLQITASDSHALPYDDDEVKALSALTKALNQGGYQFSSIDETVLQPVNGLHFKTRFDNLKPLVAKKTVVKAGAFSINVTLDLESKVLDYQILDEDGHDWKDLGSEDVKSDRFEWASTTIPEELVNHHLKLVVRVAAGNNSPALDELFVIASNNAILMRQGKQKGVYELPLPNQKLFTVLIDPDNNMVYLKYPDPETQVIELNRQYPFIGEWLKAVLPQKRAFN
ncbi:MULTISPECIES: hypothetical protein [Lacticaseibacillus]|jgi:hypothetical protein|uniref:Uncharacterized protein n=6 Tax=Lacticaseibacillus TaxID=2759736 RepID=A0AAN1C6U6_LACCA|nr:MULTISPECIES: hypothetical protein [Lacticaseibacillus]OFR91737.1 hypothetical protein HMPREF2861_12155 [Lactobacillus sp. HMSC068F07]ARY90788.1 hypothetical protein BGL52_03000 [Lacticaseibacillus casei]KAB1970651.1 hypothetical protein F9B82_04690 [Lacticaseibacillus casei]MBI6597914.1 hypothetical protein [Lacticaseibacillus casei]MBO1481617.1 hypothetical protein [Lacticaseibacillus casei]